MIAILSKAPILEDIFISELKTYFNELKLGELYPNFPMVRVSNEHPFARLLDQMSGNPGTTFDGSLFPSITIISGEDGKPGALGNLMSTNPASLSHAEVATLGDTGMSCAPGSLAWLDEWTAVNGEIRGIQTTACRQDQVSFDIWSESIQLKNELHSLLILFLTGPKRADLERRYDIRIFDATIRGQRSGNYNMDFGQLLYGAHIDVVVDYEISQAIFDSDMPGASSIDARRV